MKLIIPLAALAVSAYAQDDDCEVNCEDQPETWTSVHTFCRRGGDRTYRSECPATDGCMWTKKGLMIDNKCSEKQCNKIGKKHHCSETSDKRVMDGCLWYRGKCYEEATFVPPHKCTKYHGVGNADRGCRSVPGCDFGMVPAYTGQKKCQDSAGVLCRNMWKKTECQSYTARTGGERCVWVKAQGRGGTIESGITEPAHCEAWEDFDAKCGQQVQRRCTKYDLTFDKCMWVHGHGCTDVNNECDSFWIHNNVFECDKRDHCIWARKTPGVFKCYDLSTYEVSCKGLNKQPGLCRAEPACEWRTDLTITDTNLTSYGCRDV